MHLNVICLFPLVKAEAWLFYNNTSELEFFQHICSGNFSRSFFLWLSWWRGSSILIISLGRLLHLIITLGIVSSCWNTLIISRFGSMRIALLSLNAFLASMRACSSTHYVVKRFSFLWPVFLLIRIHINLGTYTIDSSSYTANIGLTSILLVRTCCTTRGTTDYLIAVHRYLINLVWRFLLKRRWRLPGLLFSTIYMSLIFKIYLKAFVSFECDIIIHYQCNDA